MAKKNVKTEQSDENLKKIEELTNNWKRALADYQNLQKRTEREKIEFAQYSNSILIARLLTIVDYLERVQTYLNDNGLDLAIKEFKRLLEEEGLQEIEVLNKDFNPLEMEAVEAIGGEEGTGKVTEVISKGYRLKDKIIRPAKVKVGGKL